MVHSLLLTALLWLAGPIQNVAASVPQARAAGEGSAHGAAENGIAPGAKRKADEAGINGPLATKGRAAQQQGTSPDDVGGHPAKQVRRETPCTAAGSSAALPPLPPPQARMENDKSAANKAGSSRKAASIGRAKMDVHNPQQAVADFLQDFAEGEQAAPAGEAQASAGAGAAAEAHAPAANSAAGGNGEASAAPRRLLKSARKKHNPAKKVHRAQAKPPPAPKGAAKGPGGKARKIIQPQSRSADEGPSVQPDGAPAQPDAPRVPGEIQQELQGATEAVITHVNAKYNLTTPHKVSASRPDAFSSSDVSTNIHAEAHRGQAARVHGSTRYPRSCDLLLGYDGAPLRKAGDLCAHCTGHPRGTGGGPVSPGRVQEAVRKAQIRGAGEAITDPSAECLLRTAEC